MAALRYEADAIETCREAACPENSHYKNKTMEFKSDKAIYEQIAEYVCEKILKGEWKAEDRIPSVREFGAKLTVNPNTVMRSYEYLERNGIIYSKRGIGFLISPDSLEKARKMLRLDFLNSVPSFIAKMKLLGLSFADIESWEKSQQKKNE